MMQRYVCLICEKIWQTNVCPNCSFPVIAVSKTFKAPRKGSKKWKNMRYAYNKYGVGFFYHPDFYKDSLDRAMKLEYEHAKIGFAWKYQRETQADRDYWFTQYGSCVD